MSSTFAPENLRKRFWKLTAEREEIDKELEPLREELNALVAGDTSLTVKQARAREAKIRPEIVKLQQKLAPIENERGAVARALGGQTGERPA